MKKKFTCLLVDYKDYLRSSSCRSWWGTSSVTAAIEMSPTAPKPLKFTSGEVNDIGNRCSKVLYVNYNTMEIHGFVLRRYCNSRLYMQAEMFRMEVQKNLPSHISLAFSLRLKRSDLPSPEKGVVRQ